MRLTAGPGRSRAFSCTLSYRRCPRITRRPRRSPSTPAPTLWSVAQRIKGWVWCEPTGSFPFRVRHRLARKNRGNSLYPPGARAQHYQQLDSLAEHKGLIFLSFLCSKPCFWPTAGTERPDKRIKHFSLLLWMAYRHPKSADA